MLREISLQSSVGKIKFAVVSMQFAVKTWNIRFDHPSGRPVGVQSANFSPAKSTPE